MDQLYAEAGCKPKKNSKDYMIRAAIIVGIVLCVWFALFSGTIILGFVGMVGIVAAVFLFPRLNVEYEYIFCDGQLDFDKIMGGNKRKNILKVDMEDMEICGPIKAGELAPFKNLKTKDFSSRSADGSIYAAIVSIKGENYRILFDPSKKMLEAMRMKSPRKMIRSW